MIFHPGKISPATSSSIPRLRCSSKLKLPSNCCLHRQRFTIKNAKCSTSNSIFIKHFGQGNSIKAARTQPQTEVTNPTFRQFELLADSHGDDQSAPKHSLLAEIVLKSAMVLQNRLLTNRNYQEQRLKFLQTP